MFAESGGLFYAGDKYSPVNIESSEGIYNCDPLQRGNSPCVRKSPWLLFHRVLRRPATDVYPFWPPLPRLARPRCFSATSPTSTAARRRSRAVSNRSTNFRLRSRLVSAARACPCFAFDAWEAGSVPHPSGLDLDFNSTSFQFHFISFMQ